MIKFTICLLYVIYGNNIKLKYLYKIINEYASMSVYNRFSIANRKRKIEKRFVIRFFIFQFKNKNELYSRYTIVVHLLNKTDTKRIPFLTTNAIMYTTISRLQCCSGQ